MKRWQFAVTVCVFGLGVTLQVNMARASVEDRLYEKGQITKEEWLKLKADQEKEEAIVQQRSALKNWFDKISIRGYVQARYSYLPGDKSIRSEYDNTIRDNTGFAFRRIRLVISGDITDWLSFYIQPEFADAVPGTAGDQSHHFVQLRDAYADIFLPVPFLFLDKKELRIRAGQSKIPFGFENLQSSQQRLAFDRSDGINSAANGERDLGFFLYYMPNETRKLFRRLIDSGSQGVWRLWTLRRRGLQRPDHQCLGTQRQQTYRPARPLPHGTTLRADCPVWSGCVPWDVQCRDSFRHRSSRVSCTRK